ncbi:MAG: cytochrome b/b6 domain-containing protein [Candidatus Nanopelagicales bacterium]|jgi:formate dehydrogenase subunit gamma|nr:cytochrome b/b6 domain-containing protein [Candidatus Nanopelagicales bacterium]
MAETTHPPSEDLRRFTAGERWLHLTFGTLMGVLMVTAALLYVDPLSQLVGRRALLAQIHFWSGLLLPLPLMVAVLLSPAFRSDANRLNRFLPHDWVWLRRAVRGDTSGPSGKFNAGQKLNSAFVCGATIVMFVTGLMLHFFEPLPDNVRTGATFVHDMFALAVMVMGAGHIWMAWSDPEARLGLRSGFVSRGWVRRKHPLWEE